MTDVEKKMAAALAAVSAYMQQEEEAFRQQSASTMAPAPTPPIDLNLWGLSGRQEMMTMRRLIQMRTFDRLR